MIYYFSGTGNSLQAAKDIAAGQGEKLCSIPKLMYEEDGFEHTMAAGEILGFVFPILTAPCRLYHRERYTLPGVLPVYTNPQKPVIVP